MSGGYGIAGGVVRFLAAGMFLTCASLIDGSFGTGAAGPGESRSEQPGLLVQVEPEAEMPEDAILRRLRGLGMIDIRSWRREGSSYRASAEWFGEDIDLLVDAVSGEIQQPERLNSRQIETVLRQNGWAKIRDIRRAGDTFQVEAERDGQPYHLNVDAETGRLRDSR